LSEIFFSVTVTLGGFIWYNINMKGTIEILDSVHCRASKTLRDPIYELLKFEDAIWKTGRFGRTRKKQIRSYIDKRTGIFLSGFYEKVVNHLLLIQKAELEIADGSLPITSLQRANPKVNGISFRPFQIEAAKTAAIEKRGVIVAPTGTGKTIAQMAFLSLFRQDSHALFLCHTLDLLSQTEEVFKSLGRSMQVISGKTSKEFQNKQITLATVQSYHKLIAQLRLDFADVILIDEAHHVNDRNSLYGEVLQRSLAPIKIGYTATVPKDRKRALALEGLIGPKIYELPVEEGVQMKILAKPKVTLINVPLRNDVKHLNRFKDIYERGIVDSVARNKIIANETYRRTRKDKTVLIMVKEIRHGNNIAEYLKALQIKYEFVQGKVESQIRNQIKKDFDSKKIQAVISTAVWREGINIPSLNVVLNACGGKSEIQTLQAIGRGLRTQDGKGEVEVIDFLDPYRYVAEHAITRIQIYNKEGWI